MEAALASCEARTQPRLAHLTSPSRRMLLLTLLFLGAVGLRRTWDLRGYSGDALSVCSPGESMHTAMPTSSAFFPSWPMLEERRPSPTPLGNGQPASSKQEPMRNQRLTALPVSMSAATASPCTQRSSFHAGSSVVPARSLDVVRWCYCTMNRVIL